MAKKGKRSRATTVLLGAAIVAVVIWLSRRAINKVSIGSPTMRLHSFGPEGIEFRIILPIINESDIPVTVSGFLGQLFYKGDSVGMINLERPAQLPGFGKGDIEFSVTTGYVGTALEIVSILTNGTFKPKDVSYSNIDWSLFRVQGTLKIGSLPLDVNTQLLP